MAEECELNKGMRAELEAIRERSAKAEKDLKALMQSATALQEYVRTEVYAAIARLELQHTCEACRKCGRHGLKFVSRLPWTAEYGIVTLFQCPHCNVLNDFAETGKRLPR